MNAKGPKKLFKIGEVMEFTGLSRQVLHNYTMLGLISAVGRTPSGHRLYGEEVFERIRRIRELKKSRTLLEIRQALEEGGPSSAGEGRTGEELRE